MWKGILGAGSRSRTSDMRTTTAPTEVQGMIGDREAGGEEAIRGAGEKDTMANEEDLVEVRGAQSALETTMGEVTARAVVAKQVLEAVLGTMLWVSLAEEVTVEVVWGLAENLEETWVASEVVTEALEVDLEVKEEVDEDWGATLTRHKAPSLFSQPSPSPLKRCLSAKSATTPVRTTSIWKGTLLLGTLCRRVGMNVAGTST